jgi:hypothetical protein
MQMTCCSSCPMLKDSIKVNPVTSDCWMDQQTHGRTSHAAGMPISCRCNHETLPQTTPQQTWASGMTCQHRYLTNSCSNTFPKGQPTAQHTLPAGMRTVLLYTYIAHQHRTHCPHHAHCAGVSCRSATPCAPTAAAVLHIAHTARRLRHTSKRHDSCMFQCRRC